MNKYMQEVLEKEKQLSIELEKEQESSFLKLVKRPDGAKEALEFQYEQLDSLNPKTLERYLGALSQYLIYVTKYVNILNSKRKLTYSTLSRKINEGLFLHSQELKALKSMTEKEIFVKQSDKDLAELEDYLDSMDAKLAVYSNIPDTIEGLINTIKKVYDSKKIERIAQ